jgi:hypothetical protein
MLRKMWGFVTRSFCCHDCRRLRKELEKITHEYLGSLKIIASMRQLYERDGDAIARRLNMLNARMNEIHRLMTKSGKKKRRKG